MTDEPRDTKEEGLTKKPVSRREFLKYAGLAGGLVAASGGLGGLIAACGEDTTTTTAGATSTTAGATTTTAGATTTTAGATTTSVATGPTVGGRLRHIIGSGPQNLGYWPKQGPFDEGPVFPSVERINEYTEERTIVPHLAKTFTEEPDKLTMTCELKQGIKFHDGSELTAEVAKWNYELGKNGKKLQYGDVLESFEITGPYSFVLHLTRWDNQLIHSFGWVPMYSKAAWDAAGATDEEREKWALDHAVGTGPFVLSEFIRDQSITWDKFADYWQKPLPNLDGIDYRMIPDPTIATTMMKGGEVDIWQGSDAQSKDEMVKAGFINQSAWAALIYHLMPNTVDPNSPLAKLPVREAVEYAINKEEFCQAVGYNIYKPLYDVAPPGEWGAGSGKVQRTYDPEKAKSLLVEAGYPDGCPLDLLAIVAAGGSNTEAEALKGYLDAAGFKINLDIADPGRFYGSMFGTGWKDLGFFLSGVDPNYLISCNRWWSPTPMTNLVSFQRPPEFAQMFADANSAKDEAGQIAGTEKIVGLMADQALMIPVYYAPEGLLMTDKVHTMYPKAGFIRWDWANFSLDK